MESMKCFTVATSALFVLAAGAPAQPRDEAPSIIIAGRIESRRLTVTAADLGSLPKKTVKVKTDHGVTTFEGVAIQDVLELAITQNGKPLSSADGPYRIVAPQDANHIRWIRDVKMIWVLHADTILGGTTRY